MYSRNLIKTFILSICFASFASPSFAQTKNDSRLKKIETERNRLNKFTDPGDRAESLMKIASITLTFASDAITANDMPMLTSSVEDYRRTVTVARDTMMESGLDAYKKPKGYQAIELATRSHLQILKDFARRLSPADRQPVDEVIEMVSKIRDEIVHVLFS